VENIYISDKLGNKRYANALAWPGISANTHLDDEYGNKLRAMSSLLPPSYHAVMREMGANISAGSVMMFPGNTADFISLAFQMSAATGVRATN
jgi:hypothetical protein